MKNYNVIMFITALLCVFQVNGMDQSFLENSMTASRIAKKVESSLAANKQKEVRRAFDAIRPIAAEKYKDQKLSSSEEKLALVIGKVVIFDADDSLVADKFKNHAVFVKANKAKKMEPQVVGSKSGAMDQSSSLSDSGILNPVEEEKSNVSKSALDWCCECMSKDKTIPIPCKTWHPVARICEKCLQKLEQCPLCNSEFTTREFPK